MEAGEFARGRICAGEEKPEGPGRGRIAAGTARGAALGGTGGSTAATVALCSGRAKARQKRLRILTKRESGHAQRCCDSFRVNFAGCGPRPWRKPAAAAEPGKKWQSSLRTTRPKNEEKQQPVSPAIGWRICSPSRKACGPGGVC